MYYSALSHQIYMYFIFWKRLAWLVIVVFDLYIYYVYSDCDVDIIPPHEGSKTNKQLYICKLNNYSRRTKINPYVFQLCVYLLIKFDLQLKGQLVIIIEGGRGRNGNDYVYENEIINYF